MKCFEIRAIKKFPNGLSSCRFFTNKQYKTRWLRKTTFILLYKWNLLLYKWMFTPMKIPNYVYVKLDFNINK